VIWRRRWLASVLRLATPGIQQTFSSSVNQRRRMQDDWIEARRSFHYLRGICAHAGFFSHRLIPCSTNSLIYDYYNFHVLSYIQVYVSVSSCACVRIKLCPHWRQNVAERQNVAQARRHFVALLSPGDILSRSTKCRRATICRQARPIICRICRPCDNFSPATNCGQCGRAIHYTSLTSPAVVFFGCYVKELNIVNSNGVKQKM